MTTYRFNGQRLQRLPRACSHCGRGDHKVILRYADRTREGFCPGCFATAIDTSRSYSAIHRWIETGTIVETDLRGDRTRARVPVPAELQRQREEPSHEHEGRRVWTACGHPAERDVLDGCYTCQRPLAPSA